MHNHFSHDINSYSGQQGDRTVAEAFGNHYKYRSLPAIIPLVFEIDAHP